MGRLERIAGTIAAILVREGVDYPQSKAVFKVARYKAGLTAPPDRRGTIDRLTLEEELRFIDQAYAKDGRTGLMLQTLLETGARVSKLVQMRVDDVSLAERVVVIRRGKGGRRREVPIRRELAQLLRLHIDSRRTGPLFPSREKGTRTTPNILIRQRVGQIVREVARAAAISKRVYPHLFPRHTMATRLLTLGPAAHAGHGDHRRAALPRPRGHRHHRPSGDGRSACWAARASTAREAGCTPKPPRRCCSAGSTRSPTPWRSSWSSRSSTGAATMRRLLPPGC